MWLSDAQKIGVGLTTFGGLFMLLGVMLFFDGALLALGNILFIAGLTLIIGPQKTFYFFARKQKLRGTICFLGGILLVFIKWPFVGMIVETFGFLNLFGDFFPVVITFLRQLPFIGTALSLPYISTIRYPVIKSQYPGDGRRRLHLRVLQEFWEDILQDRQQTASHESVLSRDSNFDQDDDPLDSLLEGHELGILLRTDYSNEDAWQSFCATLQGAEQELADGLKKQDSNDKNEHASTTAVQTEDSDSDMESSDGVPCPIIKVVNPAPAEMPFFHDISNLRALRLLNDVDIRPAPSPSQDQSRIKPPNRLIDQGTWQEIYTGMTIWIYDAQSNVDHCVRLVSQEGDIYGTATGDSWRIQGSRICDLQFNMSFLGMTINFGGLDRWDYGERKRNLEEANFIA
ncbi:hypothetical protein C0992_004841 [Termitomyces sp. T32_za158]|nr:hypothetical protein C0992_004841 [Termitomyces sp. T32_za158]